MTLQGTLLEHNVVVLYVEKVFFSEHKRFDTIAKEKEKRMSMLKRKIDTGALDGLRGLAALHVMCGHWTRHWTKQDLQPSLEMPLFYLLSGFTLNLSYGIR